jgi:hypothetical protein
MRITLELNLSTSGNGIICVAILAIIDVVGIVSFFCETSATLYGVFSPFRTIVGALNTDIESLLYSNYRGGVRSTDYRASNLSTKLQQRT